MPLRYPTVDAWLLRQLQFLNMKFDNWHICTGEEGDGKSKWSRKAAQRLDRLMREPSALVQLKKDGPWAPISQHWQPNFPIPRPFGLEKGNQYNLSGDSIRFGQESLLDLLSELEVGGIAIGDEIEGSKRLAMYAERLELLDHVKESRALRHNVWANFPQFTDFEGVMTRTRFRWWEENVNRNLVIIRERTSRTVFNQAGEPTVSTRWPIVARFPKTGKNDPLEPLYEMKKDSRMRDRAARRRGEEDTGPAAPVNRIPPSILDMVLQESKKP